MRENGGWPWVEKKFESWVSIVGRGGSKIQLGRRHRCLKEGFVRNGHRAYVAWGGQWPYGGFRETRIGGDQAINNTLKRLVIINGTSYQVSTLDSPDPTRISFQELTGDAGRFLTYPNNIPLGIPWKSNKTRFGCKDTEAQPLLQTSIEEITKGPSELVC
ncbi:hypothetical protein SUGI_0552360 [Cryptomeria japonica]|nr:hypothetical protein SUGI_0552360 [Cryptomeria japonica]